MKKQGVFLIIVMTMLLFSCQKEEPTTPRVEKNKGWLHIDIGLSMNVNEVLTTLKSTAQTEDFKVFIYESGGTLVMAFESVLAMPDSIELETGDYYAEAHSDNNLPAAFENPYYYGISQTFSVSSGTTQSVEVNCQLANTMVSVQYSDLVISSFLDYSTTVSTSEGSLIYEKDEIRTGYFKTLPLDILVELIFQNPDGSRSSKSLSGSITNPLPNRHYEIHVDASLDNGMATFQVILDDTPVQVEVVEVVEDQDVPAGAVAYGEILITEIMYDPSALSDTEGEWFELYNNSGETINLQNLVLVRDDLNRHVISESIELPPAGYYVVQRTIQATGASNSYVYGSAITLSNTGATLAIYNEGPESDPGSLIFSVNYGESGFPTGSGASIILSPSSLSAASAISGSSWCVSSSAYTTGDLGTPGAVNDACQ
ncbi:MAG: DUF4493 domain-containing protein [Bacteroidales bacterium]